MCVFINTTVCCMSDHDGDYEREDVEFEEDEEVEEDD